MTLSVASAAVLALIISITGSFPFAVEIFSSECSAPIEATLPLAKTFASDPMFESERSNRPNLSVELPGLRTRIFTWFGSPPVANNNEPRHRSYDRNICPNSIRPFPIFNFRHIVAVLTNVFFVFEPFVNHQLVYIRAGLCESWHTGNHVHYQMKTVEVI